MSIFMERQVISSRVLIRLEGGRGRQKDDFRRSQTLA